MWKLPLFSIYIYIHVCVLISMWKLGFPLEIFMLWLKLRNYVFVLVDDSFFGPRSSSLLLLILSFCCFESSLHWVFYLILFSFLLIVCFCFLFGLCLFVFSFALYFCWMGFYPWILFREFFFFRVCKHFGIITFIAYHVERSLVARQMNAFISIMLVVRVKKVLPSNYQWFPLEMPKFEAFYPQNLQRFQHAMKMLSIGFFYFKNCKRFQHGMKNA